MCYSAQILADYRKFERVYGAEIDIKEFVRLFWERQGGDWVRKIPKAMEAAFAVPRTSDELEIKTWIDEFAAQQASKLEQELFAQTKRLADAERKLQTKVTKAATESQRIATSKIVAIKGRLADLKRLEPKPDDSRIFPGVYAPVMVWESGRRVVKPMRYQCRPAGKPADYDVKFPGTYNARRDSLERFWKGEFGYRHGIAILNAFYENVARHAAEGRELAPGESAENVVLEFRPEPQQDMLVACLWSHWTSPGEPDLLSFAAITDAPPPEVSAAGHDRCIIPIKAEYIDAWLNPDPRNLAAQYAILEDRERLYFDHRMAA
ncbi:MAG: SOS response-associated peptidase family protein [Lysobacter sp.]